MNLVVYFVGAGFSAPLGIPVVRSFWSQSVDAYFANRAAHPEFEKVRAAIHNLNRIKTFYRTNLRDIEEVLSLLEMDDLLNDQDRLKTYQKYISDVVRHYTPSFAYEPSLPIMEKVLSSDPKWRLYGDLFLGLLHGNVMNDGSDRRRGLQIVMTAEDTAYAVVSMNYDLLFETIARHLNDQGWSEPKISLEAVTPDDQSRRPGLLPLAKLHGTVENDQIVPPTWSKGRNRDVIPAWKCAFACLKQASEIRFLGYSLPDGDAYARYLLRAAVAENERLRKIDVICRDPDGSVRKRYDNFVDFPDYHFESGDIEKYLIGFSGSIGSRSAAGWSTANRLEGFHRRFMEKLAKEHKVV